MFPLGFLEVGGGGDNKMENGVEKRPGRGRRKADLKGAYPERCPQLSFGTCPILNGRKDLDKCPNGYRYWGVECREVFKRRSRG